MNLKENEPLSKHTNFRIGGNARWFVEARSEEELREAIAFSAEKGVGFCVTGGGSNTLANDAGFAGVVIQMAMRKIAIDGPTVVAEAGAMSAMVARQTADSGLRGMEWAISLPGTIGGAVRGNAGCFGGEMGDVVSSVRVLRDGRVVDVPRDDLHFAYRESAIKHSSDIILSVAMELIAGDRDELRAKLDETLSKRKASQPLYGGSAGCVFKNYDATEEDVQRLASKGDIPMHEMPASRRLSAGWLIDKLGLKGTRIGDAKISEEHGNFIVNLGSATASDVVQLVALVKTRARNEFGIQLQEEVQYLGF
ncbi:MAG: UDP-N-acetylmuramate dehydrogenase [Candidatus Uhrbacteria bacterium]